MTVDLAEGLADDINTYLAANLPAKLDLLDAEYPDLIVLDDPVAYYVGEKTLENVPGYPAIFTIVPTVEIGRFTTDYIDATYDVVIGIMITDIDTENLRRRLYRYIRGIIEVLIVAHGGSAFGWNLGSARFGLNFAPIFALNEVFLSDAQVTTQMKRRTLETL